MNILILINSFPPEIRSASHLFYELSESLVKKGHKVTVITTLPRYNLPEKLDKKYQAKIWLKEKMKGIEVIRVFSALFFRRIPFFRAFNQFFLAFIFFLFGLFIKKPDIILVYSPPLTLGLTACFLKSIKKAPFIFNVQDIYPQTAIDLGLLKNPVLIKLAKLIENFIYQRADFITVHSQGNRDYLILNGVNSEKIKVIFNWVDTDLIKPGEKINQWRKKYNLENYFLVSFAGVMGFAQDIEIIIKSANLLKSYKRIKFLLIGEGVKKEKSQKKARELGLENVIFLPMQSREIYPQILAASDICLVTLEKEVKTPVVPGKIMSIMAAGRPIVGSFSLRGDAAKLIKEAQAGLVTEPENPQAFSQAILEIYQNQKKREKFGKNGRKYALNNFSKEKCVKKYENLFLQVIKK